MDPIPHTNDTSEGNKENLPPWLLEQSSRQWTRTRQANTPAPSPVLERLSIPRSRSIHPAHDALVNQMSDLRMYGRGGNSLRAATLPANRPKKRAELPPVLRITIWTDSPTPTVKDVDVPRILELENPVLVSPPARVRPRSSTYPAVRPKTATSERPACFIHIPLRLPLLLLESEGLGQRITGRRVKSLSANMQTLIISVSVLKVMGSVISINHAQQDQTPIKISED